MEEEKQEEEITPGAAEVAGTEEAWVMEVAAPASPLRKMAGASMGTGSYLQALLCAGMSACRALQYYLSGSICTFTTVHRCHHSLTESLLPADSFRCKFEHAAGVQGGEGRGGGDHNGSQKKPHASVDVVSLLRRSFGDSQSAMQRAVKEVLSSEDSDVVLLLGGVGELKVWRGLDCASFSSFFRLRPHEQHSLHAHTHRRKRV